MAEANKIIQNGRNYEFWTQFLFPVFRSAIRIGYFSLEVKGLENIPSSEHVIYAANHSSWLALDAFLLPFVLQQRIDAEYWPYGIIHDSLFKIPVINRIYNNCGAIPVSWVRDMEKIPKDIGSLGIFPEGDAGNSKPFWEAYRMKTWERGFVRLALNRKMRVIPVAIQGCEESMPVAFTMKFMKKTFGTIAGYPLLPFPLPSRFKFTFGKPVDLSHYPKGIQNDSEELDQIAENVRSIVQSILDRETRDRPLAKLSRFISDLKQSDVRSA